VSEEGLERLVDRIGLDKLWDEITMPGRNGQPVKVRNLVVAGAALQLDIALDNHIVRRIALAFPLSKNINVAEYTGRAEAILLKDLELEPGQSPLTKTLDKFYANLERLATLDKLSAMPWLDLQEGLAGICTSLQRIHEWDMEKIRADPSMAGKSEKFLLNTATCARHGHPVMHARDRVGLNLDYWVQRHMLDPPKTTPAMEKWVARNEGIWSLLIGCAPMGEMVYTPVRISDAWISPNVEKADPSTEDVLHAATGTVLDWLEPDPTMNEENKMYPEVIFRAFLEPSVILPQPVWLQMLQMMSMEPTYTYPQATFDSLFFPIPPTENHDPSAPRTLENYKDVVVRSRAAEVSTKRHKNTLYVYKPVYGQVLSELPFSHPKQLIALLPTLRQYALLATLLKRSFGAMDATKNKSQATGSENGSSAVSKKQELDAFASLPTPAAPSWPPTEQESKFTTSEVLPMDVTLTVHPAPRLNVVFPIGPKSANIHIEVGPNGKVRVVSQNILPDGVNGIADTTGKGKGRQYTAEDLGRVLEYFEDLDEWCQWIRTRVI
jgi:hypothetical protein